MKKNNSKTIVLLIIAVVCTVAVLVGTVVTCAVGAAQSAEKNYGRMLWAQDISLPNNGAADSSQGNGAQGDDAQGGTQNDNDQNDNDQNGNGQNGNGQGDLGQNPADNGTAGEDRVYELNPNVISYNLNEANDYLVSFEEKINTETSYSLEWAFENQASADGTVKWVLSYYELTQNEAQSASGGIQNLDVINEAIYNECAYLKQIYQSAYEQSEGMIVIDYSAKEKCSVMYNDEMLISLLCEHEYSMYGTQYKSVSDINIDLTTGQILSNNDVFCPDAGFAARFREQCLLQNGMTEMLDSLTDEEILEYLMDDDYSIVFFSEKGLEVGFNYSYQLSDGRVQQGYVTITLNDYEPYLRDR